MLDVEDYNVVYHDYEDEEGVPLCSHLEMIVDEEDDDGYLEQWNHYHGDEQKCECK